MPQLSELIEKRKFVKKEYRPWDLSGTGTVDSKKLDSEQKAENNVVADSKIVKAPKDIESEFNNSIDTNLPVIEGHPKSNVIDNVKGNILGNDIDNNKVTYEQQLDNKKVTLKKHIGNNEVTNEQQLDNKINNVLDNNLGNVGTINNLVDNIKRLSGIQKIIFSYVINVCSARGTLDTGNILSSDLAISANCSTGSIKTSLIRLIEKGLLFRLQGKSSRGGYIVLGITKETQAASIQAQQAIFNPLKLHAYTDNVIGNKSGNTHYISSSNKNNIITTLPDEWKKINYEELSHIGFSETQIRQLYDSNATEAQIVQDSINKFSYSLNYNEKTKAYTDPLNVLMGILRKGQRWIEPNYIPPKELALQQLLEEARAKKEREELMIKELVDLEFPNWRRNLTEKEYDEIVPENVRSTNISGAIQSSLRNYFIEKVILTKLDK
ncbi:Uncharacterised protein [Legionella beliardensis]|uniref:Uncharacterized protein n=1 Tax=Legionella beliardensis TaxID=91822 RepID=A0A378JRL5_9GAMM|nr:hypothetical protein [Legionella beliardensis]STX55808.1 Uncharacterised protein [Legionella beliardensis]